MARPNGYRPVVRTYEQIVDSQDLRTVITDALSATPVNEEGLRHGVWTFVGTERHAGAAPAHMIISLTELVDLVRFESPEARQAVMRNVILWCVEACYGHLGGDIVGGPGDAFADSSQLTFGQ